MNDNVNFIIRDRLFNELLILCVVMMGHEVVSATVCNFRVPFTQQFWNPLPSNLNPWLQNVRLVNMTFH